MGVQGVFDILRGLQEDAKMRSSLRRNDWKKNVSVSDEVKAELAEVVKQDFISTNGKSIPKGTRRNDVINKYLNTLPSKQRSSASWYQRYYQTRPYRNFAKVNRRYVHCHMRRFAFVPLCGELPYIG